MLSEFIRYLREKRELSQEYVAKKLGMSRPTYQQIESGDRDVTITEARLLADVLDIQFEHLLHERESGATVTFEDSDEATESIDTLHIRVTKKNLEKFKQVLLYVLGKVGGKPNVGETVLHKLLYFIDFDYFEKFEENLMGATYIKNHHGPTSVELGAIIAEMQAKGELEAVNSKYFTFAQKKYLPRTRPNLALLSARDLEHIDGVLARLSDKNAKEIELYSHEDIPWIVADEGKPLSYESVFYRGEKHSVRNYDDAL